MLGERETRSVWERRCLGGIPLPSSPAPWLQPLFRSRRWARAAQPCPPAQPRTYWIPGTSQERGRAEDEESWEMKGGGVMRGRDAEPALPPPQTLGQPRFEGRKGAEPPWCRNTPRSGSGQPGQGDKGVTLPPCPPPAPTFLVSQGFSECLLSSKVSSMGGTWKRNTGEGGAEGQHRESGTAHPQPPTHHAWGTTDPPTTERSPGTGPPHPTRCLGSLQTARRGTRVCAGLGAMRPGAGRRSPLLSASPSRKPAGEQATISGSTWGHRGDISQHHRAKAGRGGGRCVTPLRKDRAPCGPPTVSSRGERGVGVPRKPGGGGEQGGPAEEREVSREGTLTAAAAGRRGALRGAQVGVLGVGVHHARVKC